jgi:hypothetical protein
VEVLAVINKLVPTRKGAFEQECSDTTELVLLVADVIRHIAFVEKISKIPVLCSKRHHQAHLARPVGILPYVDGRSTRHFRPEREASTNRRAHRKAGTQAGAAPCGPHAHRRRAAAFQPDRDPGEIKPKRTYARRTRYFARNELSRLCMDALRAADDRLMTSNEITERIIEAKGFDAADAALRKAIGEQALALLRSFRKRGTVEQVGLGRGVRWKFSGA